MPMLVTFAAQGSSPHTRGARGCCVRAGRRLGIIPAYAGSTDQLWTTPTIAQDHPRIRGEHVISGSFYDRSTGSSPHTRGAPRR